MTQYELYRYNRARIQDMAGSDGAIMAEERRWIGRLVGELTRSNVPASLMELRGALEGMIEAERQVVPDSAQYVAGHMTLPEFRVLVQEFAIDGLTEAQSFYYVMPRLPLAAQMPMLRILIDEFGSGNLRRAHTTLYEDLLRELAMPVDLAAYEQLVCGDCLAFVNLFYWLTLRADDPSWFAGGITYLETSIPSFFECYAQACARLQIERSAYYTEHQHIDVFHAMEGQRLLREMDRAGCLDPGKAWLGAQLTSRVTAAAFESAVARARTQLTVEAL